MYVFTQTLHRCPNVWQDQFLILLFSKLGIEGLIFGSSPLWYSEDDDYSFVYHVVSHILSSPIGWILEYADCISAEW